MNKNESSEDLEKYIEDAKKCLIQYGNATSHDWSGIDGKIVNNHLVDICKILDGDLNVAQFRKESRLCKYGGHHDNSYCKQYNCYWREPYDLHSEYDLFNPDEDSDSEDNNDTKNQNNENWDNKLQTKTIILNAYIQRDEQSHLDFLHLINK